jgi:hypothetical protein
MGVTQEIATLRNDWLKALRDRQAAKDRGAPMDELKDLTRNLIDARETLFMAMQSTKVLS